MVQRHRDHHAVGAGQAQTFANHETVVEDVVMTERRPLGRASGAGGVLDVHRLIELQAALASLISLNSRLPCPLAQRMPRQKTWGRVAGQADHPAQLGQALAGQVTGQHCSQPRYQLLDHGMVIGRLEGIGAHQPAAAGLAQHVLQLAHPVGRVDIDQNRTDLGAGQLQDAPLGAVG
ncbi:hypothetical protein D3C78_1150150 [compost metagenome]